MKKILFILLLLPVLAQGQKISTEKKQLSFESLVKNVDIINLPFSHECGEDFKTEDFKITEKIDTELIKYFPPLYPGIPEYIWHIVGKVSENKKYVALLSINHYADYVLPYLTTFTKQGTLITKFELYEIGCSEDEFYHGKAIFTINKDLLIKMSDSSATYKRDSTGKIIKGSIISKSNNYLFKLMSDGTIVKAKRGVK